MYKPRRTTTTAHSTLLTQPVSASSVANIHLQDAMLHHVSCSTTTTDQTHGLLCLSWSHPPHCLCPSSPPPHVPSQLQPHVGLPNHKYLLAGPPGPGRLCAAAAAAAPAAAPCWPPCLIRRRRCRRRCCCCCGKPCPGCGSSAGMGAGGPAGAASAAVCTFKSDGTGPLGSAEQTQQQIAFMKSRLSRG
jgi:hypothetical protein